MPYIGMFTDEKVNAAIEQAAKDLGPGRTRVIFHADTDKQMYVSLVRKVGDKISVEAAVVVEDFKFDKEHTTGMIQVVGEF